jgi:hypothetical protein
MTMAMTPMTMIMTNDGVVNYIVDDDENNDNDDDLGYINIYNLIRQRLQ